MIIAGLCLAITLGQVGTPMTPVAPQSPFVQVVEIQREYEPVKVRVKVNNPLRSGIVLISPSIPDEIIDARRCVITLSAKVKMEDIDYSFTPKLVSVAAQGGCFVDLELERFYMASATCSAWRIRLELADLLQADSMLLRLGTEQDSKRFVVDHQRVTEPIEFQIP